MKNLLLAKAILVSLPMNSLAQSSTPMHEVAGVPVVQVSLNGAGPYPFVLDTAANVTMVRGQLLHALNIAATQPVTIAGSLGESHHLRLESGSLVVAGLRVDNIEIDTLEEGQLGILEGRVQGILGENFLKNFDVLIDNDHHALTLDRTSTVAQSLAGERLPLSTAGQCTLEVTHDRVIVPVRAPFLLERSMQFLLDSGANTAIVYPRKGETPQFSRAAASGSFQAFNKTRVCRVARTALTLGRQSYQNALMAICENISRDNIDSDGLLPTSLFHRLFISHRDKYIIANPKLPSKRKDLNLKTAEAIGEDCQALNPGCAPASD